MKGRGEAEKALTLFSDDLLEYDGRRSAVMIAPCCHSRIVPTDRERPSMFIAGPFSFD
jgi:hypothetical protein